MSTLLPDTDKHLGEIEQHIEALATLAQTPIQPPDFYSAFLSHAVPALDACGGTVWRWDGSQRHCIAAHSAPSDGGDDSDVSDQVKVIAHGVPDGDTRYEVELSVKADLPSKGVADVLHIFCDVAVEYHRARDLSQLRAECRSQRELQELVLRMHASLEPVETGYVIANDARHWMGCDRISVLILNGARAKALAVSGVDELDARAEEIQRMQRLASAVARTGEAFRWTAGEAAELAPEVQSALDQYVDHSHAISISSALLSRPSRSNESRPQSFAILLVEHFKGEPCESLSRNLHTLELHASSALGAALEHHQLPLLRTQLAIGRAWRSARERPVSVVLITALVVAVLGILGMVPADFKIEANGNLAPEQRRHLFAPADGVVEELLVDHGEEVTAQSTALRLRNPQLTLELSRVTGELQTARARLSTVRSRRASGSLQRHSQSDDRQLAAEEEQIREQVAGLEVQQQVLHASLQDLEVRCPMDGVVLTWNPRDRLLHRPVKRGQKLLTIANLDGRWLLELQVSDSQIGHVLKARQDNPELPVTFLLGSNTASTYYGRVRSVTSSAESASGEPATVMVTALLDEPLTEESLAGATVLAKIHCGRRSIGYVMLHDLIDAMRSRLFF